MIILLLPILHSMYQCTYFCIWIGWKLTCFFSISRDCTKKFLIKRSSCIRFGSGNISAYLEMSWNLHVEHHSIPQYHLSCLTSMRLPRHSGLPCWQVYFQLPSGECFSRAFPYGYKPTDITPVPIIITC